MAKRLTTRLSAGAALVTGIGMMGIATAVPAQAETTLQYQCSVAGMTQTVDFILDTGIDPTATVGEPLTLTPSGTATTTLSTLATAALQVRGVQFVDGDLSIAATLSDGNDSMSVPTDIAIGRAPVAEAMTLDLSGAAVTATPSAGVYTISAPDTFSGSLTGYDDAENDVGTADFSCTYVAGSGSQVIDEVTVTEEAPEPVVDDWFTEPDSLPLIDNVFTVSGEATHDGTLSIEVLAGAQDDAGQSIPGDVLTTYTMNATQGANEQDFELVEGADYVRVISQDCVDAQGYDETVVNSGCNVTYQAPWAVDGDNGDDTGTETGTDTGDNEGDDTSMDAADDTSGATPAIPVVVQTDGLTPAMTTPEDNTATLALGGLLLAGAGAGTVLVMRRRAQQH